MAEEPPWGWRRGWPVGRLTGWLCLAAALAGLPWSFVNQALLRLTGCAVLATLGLGLAAERLLRRSPVTDGVGALAGIVVAPLAHLGMMVVYAVWAVPAGRFDSAEEAVAAIFGTTVLSLLYWGWATVPLGGLAGWVAGRGVMRQQARGYAAAVGATP